jgi:hypothetical protein
VAIITRKLIVSAVAVVALATTLALAAPSAAPQANSVEFVDQPWTCNQPLSNYGPLPIVVTINYTKTDATDFGVRLNTGCVGDGDPATVDLELHVNGNGVNGTYDDAIRVMNASPGASNIVISGEADCGRARSGAHQDGIQAIGGTNISFRDFKVGMRGPGGFPSCQGAGGAIFYSGSGSVAPKNMRIEGGSFRGCNKGLNDGNGQTVKPTGDVSNALVQSGFDVAHPSACRDSEGRQFYQPTTCSTANPLVTESGLVCDRWPWGS